MSRDYSAFLPPSSSSAPAPIPPLIALGWSAFFAQQTDADTLAKTPPVRVTSVNRSSLTVRGADMETTLPPRNDATVGDWILLNSELPQDSVVMERKSLIKRRSPGKDRFEQLIAANVDTAFIVTSCNADFSIARLERYVALALDAGVTPVIVLTKPDLTDDAATYERDARTVSSEVEVLVLNAKSADTAAAALAPWTRQGQTVAFLGSSGVGKSTLSNAVTGTSKIETQAIREADAKGRHTTTRRELYVAQGGCVVLDTPGMRELQLTDAAAGLGDLFADLEELGTRCKFRDCAHDSEPGCAIKAGLEDGSVDRARFERWQKLVAEDAFNTASLANRKHREKALSKVIKSLDLKNKKQPR